MPESYQILKIETVVGEWKLKAPAGWKFDKTAIYVWSRLLSLSKLRREGFSRKKDHHANTEQLEVLGNVLSNSLGMTNFYWVQKAEEFSK